MSDRALHFVGSLPAEVSADAERAMTWILAGAGGHELTALPYEEPLWINGWQIALRDVTEGDGRRKVFDILADGTGSRYDNLPMYRVARGVRLRPEHVALGRVPQVEAKLPVVRRLRDAHGRPGLRHQVSLPSPLDLALFTLVSPRTPASAATRARALAGMLRTYRVFRDAVVGEVTELHARYGDDLVYQVETPSVLVGLWSVPAALRPAVAGVLARQLAGVLTAVPPGAAMVLHLCYGDLAHTSLVRPGSLEPAVTFLNALARRLRRTGRDLPAAHVPAAFGDQKPPLDPAFYRPLARLDPGYRLYAGVADHEDAEVSRAALDRFETAAGRRAEAVATACGMGREPLALAETAVAVCRSLAGAATP